MKCPSDALDDIVFVLKQSFTELSQVYGKMIAITNAAICWILAQPYGRHRL
jgi:hypothetical protein